jgi:pimeloyl-ACP methyl ester carboxylesterase
MAIKVRYQSLLLTAALISGAYAAPPTEGFVQLNDLRLHYVDWGGGGDVILILPGLGDTLDRFDAFAPSFTDAFHVMGMDRRGQGQSGKPASGYDTTTLASDIKGFLDAKSIRRATLIGHSIAGEEMTRFAGLFPDRLAKLVYLDAANDDKRGRELAAQANFPLPKPSDPFLAAIERGAGETHPDYAKVAAPALAFYAMMESPHVTQQMDQETKRRNELAFRILERGQREQIDQFRAQVKRATVVELRDTNHFFFQDPKLRSEVVRMIREFLRKD